MSSFSSSSSLSSAELLSSVKKPKGGLYKNARDKKTNQNTPSEEETSADLGEVP